MSDFEKGAEARFWAKVDKRGPDECWPWTGSTDGHKRGSLSVNGKRVRAPRIAWELANGRPLDASLFACHSCDNPNCVNPAHIWAGTPADNIHDAWVKGRVVAPPINPWNARKTHCPQGHPYAGENLILRKAARGCKACKLANQLGGQRRRAAKRRALDPSIRRASIRKVSTP